MLTTYKPKCSFLPSNFGYFGAVHSSLDLLYNAGACLDSVFYPTPHDVNLTYSERLFKQMNKGDRPYRFTGSAISIASTAINFTASIPVVGAITSIVSCVLGIILTSMQIMKDLDNYDRLIEKLEKAKSSSNSDHWDKIQKKVVAKKNAALRSHNTTLVIHQCFLISTIAMLIVAPQIIVPVMVALTLISFLRKVINIELGKRAAVDTHAMRLLSPKFQDHHQDNNITAKKNTLPVAK